MENQVLIGIAACLVVYGAYKYFSAPKTNPYREELLKILNEDEYKVKGRYR